MRVDTPRGTFHVRAEGHGSRTVLLLHSLALSGECWAPFAAFLAEDARVLALDIRGHGESPWDGRPFTVEELADDAAAAIEASGVEGCGVVGMSMGGCVALALAVRHPRLVDRLVLADTTSCYGDGRVEAWAERARNARSRPRAEQVPFQIDRWFTEGFRTREPAEVRRIADIFVGTDSAVHAAACEALGAFDCTAALGGVEADTVVMVGDEDYATPPSMAEALARGIPRARLDLLRGTRHLSLIERRDLWPALRESLSRAEGGG